MKNITYPAASPGPLRYLPMAKKPQSKCNHERNTMMNRNILAPHLRDRELPTYIEMNPTRYIKNHVTEACELHAENQGCNNGIVFSAPMSRRTTHQLIKLFLGLENGVAGERMYIDDYPPGSEYIIKVAILNKQYWADAKTQEEKKDVWIEFLEDAVADAAYLQYLREQKPIKITTQITIYPADVSPKLYFAGSIKNTGMFITVMERIQGDTLQKHLYAKNRRTRLPITKETARLAANTERTVLSCLAFGLEHGDAHERNIIVEKRTGKVKFIDFGRSLVIPQNFRDRAIALIKQGISGLRSKAHQWNNTATDAFLGRMLTRTYENSYSPSFKLIKVVRHGLTKRDIDAARIAVWRPTTIYDVSPRAQSHLEASRKLQGTGGNADAQPEYLTNLAILLPHMKFLTPPKRRLSGHAEPFVRHRIKYLQKMNVGTSPQVSIYTITMNAKVRDELRSLRHDLQNVVVGQPIGMISDGTPLVIKVINMPSYNRNLEALWKEFLFRSSCDAVFHKLLMERKPIKINPDVILDPADIAPRFFFGGSSNVVGVYVTVMERVLGKTAKEVLRDKKASTTVELAAKIERAVLTAIALGFEHGDAHLENVIVEDGTQKVKFIDFGMSMMLPQAVREQAITAIKQGILSLAKYHRWNDAATKSLLDGDIKKYVNARMVRRKYRNFYNPSFKLLQAVRSGITKFAMDRARLSVWSSATRKRSRNNANF